jgi:hypothetical protein
VLPINAQDLPIGLSGKRTFNGGNRYSRCSLSGYWILGGLCASEEMGYEAEHAGATHLASDAQIE